MGGGLGYEAWQKHNGQHWMQEGFRPGVMPAGAMCEASSIEQTYVEALCNCSGGSKKETLSVFFGTPPLTLTLSHLEK